MDYWRRACGVSRLEHIRNDEIRTRVQRGKDIMDDKINTVPLLWSSFRGFQVLSLITTKDQYENVVKL